VATRIDKAMAQGLDAVALSFDESFSEGSESVTFASCTSLGIA
jgi:hypothetical protein